MDLNGQARTWLSSNYDLIHGTLDVLGFVPVLGTAISALSIGLDLATGHPENVMLDSLGLIPMAGAGLHLGARAVTESLKVSRVGLNFDRALASINPLLRQETALAGVGRVGLDEVDDAGRMFSRSGGVGDSLTHVDYGDQYTKVGRRKALKPNVEYTNKYGYTHSTDSQGRIVMAKGDLQKAKGRRNGYAQSHAGREDRLPTDDGGHMIASMFGGSGNMDNLVAQARSVNRSGGEWYKMEQKWSEALDDGSSVSVKIKINYDGESLRPNSFNVSQNIDGITQKFYISN